MRTEGEFNAQLSKRFKAEGIMTLKICDRMSLGISDFLLFRRGLATALEVKFLTHWPADAAQLLKHPFTGPQQTFLESFKLAGHNAYGLVVVRAHHCMAVIPASEIPLDGNWNTLQFGTTAFPRVKWLDAAELAKLIGLHIE